MPRKQAVAVKERKRRRARRRGKEDRRQEIRGKGGEEKEQGKKRKGLGRGKGRGREKERKRVSAFCSTWLLFLHADLPLGSVPLLLLVHTSAEWTVGKVPHGIPSLEDERFLLHCGVPLGETREAEGEGKM